MEEAPENGKESSHSAHANGMNEGMKILHVSVIFCAHHQELSTVHSAIGTFHAGHVTASKQSQFGTYQLPETCRVL